MKFFLYFILISPLFLLLFINKPTKIFKLVTLNLSFAICALSYFLYLTIDISSVDYYYSESISILPIKNLFLNIGIDSLSLSFILLTTTLMPLCFLASWNSIKTKSNEYFLYFYILEILVLMVFSVNDLLSFYIFFESVLIPMFIIIGIWGSRFRKIHAALQFFLYTLAGSLFLLLVIISIYYITGSFYLDSLYYTKFSPEYQKLLWFAFLIAFAVKVPMVPVHIWLPEAHVEAPTAGSMVLAGILLKLGTYGFLKYSIPLTLESSLYYSPFIYLLSFLGIIYAALNTIRQVDLKKIIAYSSVAHMSYVTLGLFSFNEEAIYGSIFLMISHGIVSSALFFMIGCLYDRYGTRILSYYGGLVYTMPIFSTLFLIFTLGNMSLPGTSSFIGEILILIGVFKINSLLCFVGGLGTLFGAAYSIWLYNRTVFLNNIYFNYFLDLTRLESYILCIFLIFLILLGIYASPLLILFESNIVQRVIFF